MSKRQIIRLVCNQQIGDCLKTTTIAKFFKEQYPENDIEIAMSHPVVFHNNPNVINSGISKPKVINAAEEKESKKLNVVCNQDDDNGKVNNPWTIHKLKENQATFTMGMVGYINAKYGFNLKITQEEPEIFLTDEEKKPFPDLPQKYWVIKTGGEKKNTRKHYPVKYWKKILAGLPEVTFVQEGLSKDQHPTFPELTNVINGLDKYDVRKTFRLIYHSQGVISPITFSHHTAAAFKKPCICLAGGGEDVSWENYKYDGFNYLHTIGSFDCCQSGGCWKDHCTNKEEDGTQKCMEIITPEIVINLVKKYGDTGKSN